MMTPERRKHISDKAWKVRQRLGLNRCEAFDVGTYINRLRAEKHEFENFDCVAKLATEMGSDEAWADTEAGVVYVQESVLNDALSGYPRARFTIAHETGHLVLGHTGAPRRNPDKKIYQTAREREMESEADYFASCFLAPVQLAANVLNSQELEARFRLSSAAAEIAFKRIQYEKRILSGSVKKPPRAVIDYLKEAEKRGYQVRSNIEFDE